MKILLLGGTRFTGRLVAKRLLALGHEVTVGSRNTKRLPSGARGILGERNQILSNLSNKYFDIVLDFICYDSSGPQNVKSLVNSKRYVLISSTWVPTWFPHIKANQPATGEPCDFPEMLETTKSYLRGKVAAENTVLKIRKIKKWATILRLPVMWGLYDHTKRSTFYQDRATDGAPIILVDGGTNIAQIAWNEDIANLIVEWLSIDIMEQEIWEALPGDGYKTEFIIRTISTSANKKSRLVCLDHQLLRKNLPEYLDSEPLWREGHLEVSTSNLFANLHHKPTPFLQWITKLGNSYHNSPTRELRKKEVSLISCSTFS